MKKRLSIALSCFVLLSYLPVNAATRRITPANKFRYMTKKASYYNKSTSTYYRSIWTNARKAWNGSKTFKWSTTKNKKSRSFTTSVNRNSGIWTNATGMTYNGLAVNRQGVQTGAGMYLNRTVLTKYHYTKKQRTNVAIHEMGHALGLAHNDGGSVSAMNLANRTYALRNCDIRGAKQIYASAATTTKTLATAAQSTLTVDHLKDYDNGITGVEQLKKSAPIIVEGHITKSVNHHKAPKNYYTTQTLAIDKAFKGNVGATLTFTQGGTTHMAVTASEILPQHQTIIVMLAKNTHGTYYVINDGQGMFVDTYTNNGNELFDHVSDHAIYTEAMLH